MQVASNKVLVLHLQTQANACQALPNAFDAIDANRADKKHDRRAAMAVV
jgi:hypothetical protein